MPAPAQRRPALINSDTGTAATVTGTITNETFTVGGAGDITLNTVDYNTLTMDGTGTLTLAGTSDNSSLGVVVDDGTVILDKASSTSPDVHAIGGGGLTINDGIVQLSGTGGAELWSGASISVNTGGTLDLNGQTLSNNLTIAGAGAIAAGALTNSDASTAASVTGAISNESFTIGGAGDITLNTVNGGTLTMDGSGTLILAGSSDNTNLGVVVADGTVILDKASSTSPDVHAIGGGGLTINGGVVQLSGTGGAEIWGGASVNINSGGTLDLDGQTLSNSLAIAGTGATAEGALTNSDTGAAAAVTGTITNDNFTIGGAGNITLDAVEYNTLTMDGTGVLTLAGSSDNSSLGVVVDDGTVILDKASSSSPDVHAIGGGGLTINDGTVQLSGTGDSEIYGGASVTINSGGTLDLNGQTLAAGLTITGRGSIPKGADQQQRQYGRHRQWHNYQRWLFDRRPWQHHAEHGQQ